MSAPGQTSSQVVEQALGLSRADDCVVVVSEGSRVDLRFAGNTLTTNGAVTDRTVAVVSVVGRAVGVRSASVVDGSPGGTTLEELVRASEQAARDGEPAEDAGPLVQPGDLPPGVPAEDPSFGEGAERTTTAVFGRLAEELGGAFARAREAGQRLYGFATHDSTTTWLGTSSGLRRRHVQPTGSLEVTGKGDGPGQSTWWGQSTRDFTDLSVPDVEAEVTRRLGWAQRRVELPAGRYETLLPPSAVADLLVYTYWSAAGRDAAEGRSVFSREGGRTRVGEALGPAGLSVWSDPAEPGLETAPFAVATASSATTSVFDNGMPLPRSAWLSGGHLSALVETRHSAAARGVPVTPYVHNLCVDAGGSGTVDDLVASTERGLLLTCLWYIREVDPETLLLTGLTRDGVYLVEGGEVVGVVNNFRFNESPVDLLGRVAEASGAERCLPREWSDWFTWARVPAFRVPDFNMSSVSQAD